MSSPLVVDTHPLIWYAGDRPRKLGRKARRALAAFEAGEQALYVPSPVVLETWFLVQNRTVRVETTFAAWWRALARPELVHIEMTYEDVLSAAELEWDHEDPFDRLIVAIALRLDCALITGDSAIIDWGGVPIVW